jgi:hypothetical protein
MPLVDVVAAEVRVTVGAHDVDDLVAHLEDRDVERTATEVVDRDEVVLGLVEAIRQRRCRRLVHDSLHVESGDLAGILGSLTLRVIEVRGHGDDRFRDGLTEVVLRGLLQLAEHLRGNLGWRELLASNLETCVAIFALDDVIGHTRRVVAELVVTVAHETLGRINGAFGVGDGLSLGDLTDEDLALVVPCHYRRCNPVTLLIDDDLRVFALHHRDDRVGRPEVDADNLSHVFLSPFASELPSELSQPNHAQGVVKVL